MLLPVLAKAYPFSLITSQGLGVAYASHAETSSLVAAHAVGASGVHAAVNVVTGNVCVQDRSFALQDQGAVLQVGYVYNSLVDTWRFAAVAQLSMPIKPGQKEIVVQEVDGHVTTYTYNELTHSYHAPAQDDGTPTISFDAATSTWVWSHPKTNTSIHFDQHGNGVAQMDAFGRITHFKYDTQHQLTDIVCPSGVSYQLKSDDNKQQLIRVENNQQTVLHTYQLDDKKRLVKSETADGLVSDYHYQDHALQQVNSSDGTSLHIGYDANKQIKSFAIGDDAPQVYTFDIKPQQACVTDACDNTLTVTSNAEGKLAAVSNANCQVDFAYHAAGYLNKITYPDQSVETFEHADVSGLLTKHTERDGLVHESHYHVSEEGQWLLAEQSTANTRTHYLYETTTHAKHPLLQFQISPEGRVTEFLHNELGLLSGIRHYLDVFSLTEFTLDDIQVWKTKHLQQTALTTFEYDACGRLQTKKVYANINEKGEGIEDNHVQETAFEWDALNQLTQQVLSGHTQRFKHDGWQRLLKQTLGADTALASVTSHVYQDKTEKTIHPDAHIETSTHNGQGDIEKTVEKNEETVATYLPNGDHYKVTLPDGTSHYELTDEASQIHYQISSLGIVSAKQYHPQTRGNSHIQYAKAITIQDPLTLSDLQAQLLTLRSDKDRTTRQILDKNGKPKYAIDALNYVTEYRYNEQGLETASIQYAAALSEQEQTDLVAGLTLQRVPDRQNARIHTTQYDQDQLKIAEQDAAGYITYFKYDGAGRLIEKNAALQPDSTIIWAANKGEMTNPSAWAKHRYVYNALDQLTCEVDVEGYVTTYTYLPNGKKASVTRYETSIVLDARVQLSTQPTVQPSKNDKHTTFEYDALDRLIKTKGPHHQTTTFTYDAMGRQIATSIQDARLGVAVTADQTRSHEQAYDELGHLITEINPLVADALKKLDLNTSLTAEDKKTKRQEIIAKHSDHYVYEHGLKAKAIDALGNQTLFYYDADHRPVIKIDHHGSVIETTYNTFGDVERERHYFNQVPADVLAGLTGGLINKTISDLIVQLSSPTKDSQTDFSYDARGHVQTKQVADAGTATYQYNAFGECEQETQPSIHDEPLIVSHEYNAKGQETTTHTKHKATGVSATVKREYDHYLGKQTSLTNEVGMTEHYQHGPSGQLLSVSKDIDPNQTIVTSAKTYDAFNRVLTETDANGHVTTYEYDDQALTVTIIHPDSTKTLITKNIFGDTISIQDPLGHVELFEHDATGQVTTHKTEASGVTKTKHDYLGRVVTETHADGAKTKFHYQGLHLQKQVTKANQLELVTEFEVDGLGRQSAVLDATGVRTEKTYNRANQLEKSILDPNGLAIKEERSYYANGLLKQIQKGDRQEANQYQEQMIYDAEGKLIEQIIDPEGLAIRHKSEYDQAHRLITEYNPTGHYKKYHYNALNQRQFAVEQIDDQHARLLAWTYDAAGNITSTRVYSTRLDQSVAFDADREALLTLDKTVDDAVQHFVFDANHHERYKLTVFFDPATRIQHAYVEETVRDAAGHPVLTIQHQTPIPYMGSANFTLKDVSQLVDSSSTKNQFTRRVFDAAGRERFSIDHQGKIQETRYDAVGQVTAKITYGQRYPNAMTLLKADANELATITAGFIYRAERDKGEWFIYDGAGRCTHEVNPMGGVVRHIFNANGKLEKKIYFHSKTKQLSDNYADMVSDISAWEVQDGTDAIVGMTYDAAGRLKTSTDALGNQESFTYDALGNQLTHTNREQQIWTYKYNRANQCTHKISPETTICETELVNGKLVASSKRSKIIKQIDVDANGNQTGIISALNLKDQRQLIANFNGLNQLISTTLKDVEIDDPQKLIHVTDRPVKKATLETKIYYNTRGQKIAESDEAGRYCYFVYDAIGRLTHEINKKGAIKAHTYDAFDRIIKTVSYATIPNINWINYRESGIPLYVMHDSCIASPADRTTIYQHDVTLVSGDSQTHEMKEEVPYYSDGESGVAKPTVTERHTVFDQVRCVSQLIRPGLTADTYRWHDHSGNVVLEVNSNLYVTQYQRDAFGELKARVEFANPLLGKPDPNASWNSILDNVKHAPNKDKTYLFRYDLAGNLLEERQENVTVQQNIQQANNSFRMEDVVIHSVKSYQYNAEQKKISENDNGRCKRFVRDELSHIIGETAPSRRSAGETHLMTPYTEYGVDAHGKRIKTRRCANSVNLENLLPPDIHAKDQIDLVAFDQRGLTSMKQNAAGILQSMTYTPGRQVACEIHPQVIWNAQMSLVPVLDHTRLQYDDEDQILISDTYRNGVLEKSSRQLYTAFSEPWANGEKDSEWPLYISRDNLGRIWSSNRTGSVAITLFDLMNRPTMTLKSPNVNLQQYDLKGSLNLLALSPDNIVKYETIYDNGGRMTATKSPLWFRRRPLLPTTQQIHDRWHVVTDIDATGSKTLHEYNQIGFETKTTLAPEKFQDEKGVIAILPATTQYGCNIWGEGIAMCDAKNHTQATLRDEAGQQLVVILADGTFNYTQYYDLFGYIAKRLHFSGGVTTYERDYLNQCLSIIHPSKLKRLFGYDLRGNRNLVSDYHGYLYHLNFNTQDVVIDNYDPTGGLTHIIPDHNGKAVVTINPDGTTNRIGRSFFSKPLRYTDAGGNTIDVVYDGMAEILDRIGQATGSHGIQYVPNANITALSVVPARGVSLHYVRQDGLLYQVHDLVNNKYYVNNFNIMGLQTEETIKNSSGVVLSHMATAYDSHRRPIRYAHNYLKPATGYGATYVENILYDQVDNIRLTTRVLTDQSSLGERVHACSSYADFDVADRVIIFDGVLTAAGIAIAPGAGIHFSHTGPLRCIEETISPTQGLIKTNIQYTSDLEPWYSAASNGVATSVQRTPRYQYPNQIYVNYIESFPGGNSRLLSFATPLGQETYGEYWEGRLRRNNELSYDPHRSYPSKQLYRTILDDGVVITDTYTISPATFDDYRPHVAKGSRERQGNHSAIAEAHQTWDSNGYSNAKSATADERECDKDTQVYFDNDFNGRAFAKHRLGFYPAVIPFMPPIIAPSQLSHYFFHTLDGQVLGGVSERRSLFKFRSGEMYYPKKIKRLGKTERTPENGLAASPERLGDAVIASFPAFNIHRVQEGETILSIAQQYFGGGQEAVDEILRENDFLLNQPLAVNSMVNLPPFVQNTLKSGSTYSYNQFLGIIQGSILPYLTTPELDKPKSHHQWWKTIAKIIVVTVALMIAPAVSAAIINTLGASGITAAMIYGASIGLMDAVAQGVAIGAGLQEHFSLSEVAELALTGGMMKGFNVDITQANGLFEQVQVALEVGGIAATVQLSEMAMGLRSHFDIQAVIGQMAALLVSEKLDRILSTNAHQSHNLLSTARGRTMNVISAGAKSIANDYLGMTLHHVPVDVENLATQALGSMAATSVEDHFSVGSDDAKSSKKQDYAKTRANASTGHLGKTTYTKSASHRQGVSQHRKLRSSHADVDLMLAEDLASQSLVSKPELDISSTGIAQAKAYAETQSVKARYARALDRMGLRSAKPKPLTFDDLMESAGTINAVRDATVYPFEHPVEFAKGIYKLGAVGVKAMQYQYSAQDYVNFGMSVTEGVSRWRSDLNSTEAYTRGYAKGELLGLFMPGSGAEVGVAKLGMFAARIEKAGKAVQFSSKSRLKVAQLPTRGRVRFVPMEDWHPTTPLIKGRNGGYLDKFKNEWVKGPSRTKGHAFEWDVQLSTLGRKQLGWASRDKKHLNVSLDGRITHR